MINKEEREKKIRLFEIELTEFEQKKKQRQQKIDLFLKKQKGGIFGNDTGGDLFAEIRQRQKDGLKEDVFN